MMFLKAACGCPCRHRHWKVEMGVRAIAAGLDRLFGKIAEQFERYLRRPGAAPVLIVSFWACAVLPNLTVRSFIYEEGTNAEIARDILAHGRLLQPFVYGVRWHEKPSLLAWLISGFAGVTGGVNEWSARLLMPRPSVADFARLRPDLDIRVVVDSLTGAQLTASRIDKR